MPTYASTYRMDDPEPGKTWQLVNQVNHPRVLACPLVLADGSIGLFSGCNGVGNGVLAAEIFQPPALFPSSDGAWHVMASQSIDRQMHAVALLLPNGSVWLAGGDAGIFPSPAPAWHSYEIFKPPYHFQLQRPVIDQPGGMWQIGQPGLNTSFLVVNYGGVLPGGTTIERVALIRLGATTHHDDQHQRYVDLPFQIMSQVDDVFTIDITPLPPAAQVAPAGHYMLVVVDSGGKPSPARIIELLP